MRHNLGRVLAAALAAFACLEGASAAEPLRCARFSQEELPAPTPSPYPSALERLKWINQAVNSTRYSMLIFGDSLTEGWDATVWERSQAPRGALNAGVSGDRTDHLLWRLQHGNLAGPQPKAVVQLIGTNDLAYGRSPELTADGIRANLEMLRQRLPEARILLLGLLPREESPSALLRVEVAQVNRLIRDCADVRIPPLPGPTRGNPWPPKGCGRSSGTLSEARASSSRWQGRAMASTLRLQIA
jgi:GDSL-like Lipase/Acylhydrolase family